MHYLPTLTQAQDTVLPQLAVQAQHHPDYKHLSNEDLFDLVANAVLIAIENLPCGPAGIPSGQELFEAAWTAFLTLPVAPPAPKEAADLIQQRLEIEARIHEAHYERFLREHSERPGWNRVTAHEVFERAVRLYLGAGEREVVRGDRGLLEHPEDFYWFLYRGGELGFLEHVREEMIFTPLDHSEGEPLRGKSLAETLGTQAFDALESNAESADGSDLDSCEVYNFPLRLIGAWLDLSNTESCARIFDLLAAQRRRKRWNVASAVQELWEEFLCRASRSTGRTGVGVTVGRKMRRRRNSPACDILRHLDWRAQHGTSNAYYQRIRRTRLTLRKSFEEAAWKLAWPGSLEGTAAY